MKKINIAVLMGGQSAEREVSLHTGEMIVSKLNPKKYNITPVEISSSGKWFLIDDKKSVSRSRLIPVTSEELVPVTSEDLMHKRKIDFVFVALHGPYGEDGTVQGLLELLNVPYSGSGVLGSAIGMNKLISKKLYQVSGFHVAPYLVFEIEQFSKHKKEMTTTILSKIGIPCVVKPVELGSSVGVSIVSKKKALHKGLSQAYLHGTCVMVEKFIPGREFTCGVLGNRDLKPLPVTEILPQQGHAFYNYKAKYNTGGSKHVCPADIPQKLSKQIQELALRAHKVLECRGMSRSDFRFDDDNLYILETNTIPGMTPTSLLPEAAKADGMAFDILLDTIIHYGREEYNRRKTHK